MANIVEAVKKELMDGLADRLASSVGGGVDSIMSTANVAAPAMLKALEGLASSPQGAESLLAAIRGFDAGSPEQLRRDLAEGRSGDLQRRGEDVLGSLLGAGLPALIKVLSQFEEVAPGLVKGLLGYLAPLILNLIATQLKGKGGLSAANLTSFFAEQKSYITGAIPPEISLAGLPLAPQRQTSAATGQANVWTWLAPLAGLAVIGLLIWYGFFQQAPTPPVDVNRATVTPSPTDLPPIAANPNEGAGAKAPSPTPPESATAEPLPPTVAEVVKRIGEANVIAIQAVASVNSAETAATQLPVLTDLGPKLDEARSGWDKLTDVDKAKVVKSIAENRDSFKALVEKLLKTPEIAEKLKGVLEMIVAKLDGFNV